MLEQLRNDFDALKAIANRLGERVSSLESVSQSHFDMVRSDARCIVAESYDDPSRYPLFNKSDLTGIVAHNATEHAAAFTILAGQMSLADQFTIAVPRFENETFSLQWETKYDPVWQHGGKAFQVECGGAALGIELQITKFPNRVNDYEIIHSIRWYLGGTVGGNGYPEQLSTGPHTQRNVQPPLFARIRQIQQGVDKPGHVGEGGRAYIVRPGQWVRYTLSWYLGESPARLKLWIADESTDPTLVMSDPDNPALGFIAEPVPHRRWVRSLKMPEFNNSKSIAPVDSTTLVRNVVVYRGADVPLGGRP